MFQFSVHNIFAFLVWFFAFGYTAHAIKKRSALAAKYRGHNITRKNQIILGKIESLVWNGVSGYTMRCVVPDVDEPVELPLPKRLQDRLDNGGLKNNVPISLIQSPVAEGYAYKIAPVSFVNSSISTNSMENNGMALDANSVEKLNIVLYALFAFDFLLLLISFAAVVDYPMFAILLMGLEIASISRNIPFQSWTNEPESCIIKVRKKKEQKGNAQDSASNFPKGYENWSETEKELYDIDARIGVAYMDGKEFSSLDAEENPETGSNWENLPNTSKNINPESEEMGSIVPKPCWNCGCVVAEDHFFCPHCGSKLRNMPDDCQTALEEPVPPDTEVDIEAVFDDEKETENHPVETRNNSNNKKEKKEPATQETTKNKQPAPQKNANKQPRPAGDKKEEDNSDTANAAAAKANRPKKKKNHRNRPQKDNEKKSDASSELTGLIAEANASTEQEDLF